MCARPHMAPDGTADSGGGDGGGRRWGWGGHPARTLGPPPRRGRLAGGCCSVRDPQNGRFEGDEGSPRGGTSIPPPPPPPEGQQPPVWLQWGEMSWERGREGGGGGLQGHSVPPAWGRGGQNRCLAPAAARGDAEGWGLRDTGDGTQSQQRLPGRSGRRIPLMSNDPPATLRPGEGAEPATGHGTGAVTSYGTRPWQPPQR